MSAETVRQALCQLYESVWPRLIATMPKDEDISLPLFIDPADAYFSAELRLMIVGQETGGWGDLFGDHDGKDPIEHCQKRYREVVTSTAAGGYFFKGVRKLQRLLAPGVPPGGFIWANLFPCDQRKSRPTVTAAEKLLSLRVLPEEVKILQPHVVVFFTGPWYNKVLERLFPEPTYPPCAGDLSRWVSRVNHAELPPNTFRTYHPGFLLRRKRPIIEPLADLIRHSRPDQPN